MLLPNCSEKTCWAVSVVGNGSTKPAPRGEEKMKRCLSFARASLAVLVPAIVTIASTVTPAEAVAAPHSSAGQVVHAGGAHISLVEPARIVQPMCYVCFF